MTLHRQQLGLGIFVITVLAFARLIACDFTWWDDDRTIHQNSRLNPPTWSTLAYYWTTAGEHETMGLYVPVTYTAWAGLARLGQRASADAQGITLNAAVFHLANVLLHAVTVLLVFQLLFRLFASHISAMFGALLFATHPVQVESVAWVSGTKDLLCGLLSIAALLMYVRSVQISINSPRNHWSSRWRYLVGTQLFLLAMLSKPTAVVVPLMAVVIAVFLLRCSVRRTFISLLPWFVLMIPCVIWTQKVQPATWTSPLPQWAKPAVAADAIAFYLCKLVWPWHLCIDYGRTPTAILADGAIYYTWILPIVLAALLWWKGKRCPTAIAGAFLFSIPLLPLLGFVPFEFQVISTTADHYLYLPMLGVSVFATGLITRYRSRVMLGLGSLLIVALTIRSVLQESTWQDTRSLFQHAIEINPQSIVSFDGLGFLAGRDARRLPPGSSAARDHFRESIHYYTKSLQYDPTSVQSTVNLWLDYQQLGIQPPVPPNPHADPMHVAEALIQLGDTPGAIPWLDDVLQRDPANFRARVMKTEAIPRLRPPNSTGVR